MMSVTSTLRMLTALFLLSAASGAAVDTNLLRLEIGLSKTTFLMNQPIWLDVTLTNVSSDAVRIFGFWPPCQGGRFGIEVKDEGGKVLPHSGPVYNVVRGQGWTMKPQEEYYGCFNLLELFNTYRGLRKFFWQVLPPGSYRVRARYENIYSQEMPFEVVEPTGSERDAYQLLLKADSLLWQKGVDAMRQKLQELIARMPGSVYVEIAHRELLQRGELLEEFPNSGYNAINLKALTRELAPKQKQEFLEKVIRDFPGTRSTWFAQQMLARPELVGE